MKRLSGIAACVAMVACGGSRTAPSTEASSSTSREVAPPVEGTYDFVATLPGQPVRGTLQLTADTVLFSAVDGCLSNLRSEPINNASNAGVFRYACNTAVLAFDRRNPERSSKWSANVSVPRLREICAERAVRSGREVCVRTTTERYEILEPRSGSIQVTRRR